MERHNFMDLNLIHLNALWLDNITLGWARGVLELVILFRTIICLENLLMIESTSLMSYKTLNWRFMSLVTIFSIKILEYSIESLNIWVLSSLFIGNSGKFLCHFSSGLLNLHILFDSDWWRRQFLGSFGFF